MQKIFGSMFVWIPRFGYRITSLYNESSTTGGKIEIEFLKDTTNVGEDTNKIWTNETGEGNWNVHPAFTFGKDELNGFWMAKFEASNDGKNNVKIIPNATSWKNISINDSFNKVLEMNDLSNIYKINENTLDTHMVLNMEWGAVVYLTQSSYGRNEKEVTRNGDSSYHTGGGTDYTANVNQSTTGNITGIYDMSGGAWERVSAYVNNKNVNLRHGQSLVDNANTKYVEVYNPGEIDDEESNYAALSNVYGNAIWETSSGSAAWYSDSTTYPYSGNPFFNRGGLYGGGINSGLFYFNIATGSAHGCIGFRMVLAAV